MVLLTYVKVERSPCEDYIVKGILFETHEEAENYKKKLRIEESEQIGCFKYEYSDFEINDSTNILFDIALI